MISDKLSTKNYVVIDASEAKDVSILDLSDNIAAVVFSGENDKIESKAAEWAAQKLKTIEDKYNGIVILCSENNLYNEISIDEDPLSYAKAFQDLTTTIRHYSKPVVSLLKGEVLGFGYEIALNSHAVIAYPNDVKFSYDFSKGFSPMGGGLTAQIIDTYEIGENTPGHDIVPFLKRLLNNICFPKKIENIHDARTKGLLPKNTQIIKKDDDILEKGKQKALNMFLEGFESIPLKTVEVTGTTGSAALEIVVVNSHEGLFLSDAMYEAALKIAGIIGGGNVPKKTLVPEQQFLKLEAQAFADLLMKKRSEVTK